MNKVEYFKQFNLQELKELVAESCAIIKNQEHRLLVVKKAGFDKEAKVLELNLFESKIKLGIVRTIIGIKENGN